MKLLVSAKNVSEPTVETIATYAHKRFAKLVKFIPKKAHFSPTLNVEADYNKRKKQFELKVVLNVNKKTFVYKIEISDIRAAIDIASSNIKHQLVQNKGKQWRYGLIG